MHNSTTQKKKSNIGSRLSADRIQKFDVYTCLCYLESRKIKHKKKLSIIFTIGEKNNYERRQQNIMPNMVNCTLHLQTPWGIHCVTDPNRAIFKLN